MFVSLLSLAAVVVLMIGARWVRATSSAVAFGLLLDGPIRNLLDRLFGGTPLRDRTR